MMNAQQWAAELESTLAHRSGAQRAVILRQITDLFLAGAGTLSNEHIAVFDDVISRLIERIEREALIELSERLAPVDNAPAKVIGCLSRNDDIQVSGPVLEQSRVLTDPDLVEIAQTKGQSHLSAIAGRKTISEMVTAVLFGRGNADVARKVAENPGARISAHTLESVVKRARQDADLTEAVAKRTDLPQQLFDQLVQEATETVRRRLLARAAPDMRERVTKVLSQVAARVARTPTPQTVATAGKSVVQLDLARLRARVMEAVKERHNADLAEAVAVLCQVSVKAVSELIRQGSAEGLIILGKAGGMAWPDLQEVLKVAVPGHARTSMELSALFNQYAALSAPKAQIAASFIRTSKSISRADIARLM
jgi:uncharacterized protein (DUF2336 family)